MEPPGRSVSFGFPVYDGSLPRAVRSSRGRGEGLRKPKVASKGMGFFELLASVAGQLLQGADKDELQKANLSYELAKSKRVDQKENSLAEKQNDLFSEEQIGALLNELQRGEVAAAKLSCGFIEFAKRKGESEHEYVSFGRWIKSEEDVGFIGQGGTTFDYESPPVVSSGSSSGEAPIRRERKTSEMDSHLLKERRTGRRQDLPNPTCSKTKVRDNDENSSESTVPETTPKKTSKLSHMKALKARRLVDATNRNALLGAGSKRKHTELEDGRFRRVGMSQSQQRMTRFLAFKKKAVEGSSYDVPSWNLNTEGVAAVENVGADGEPPASAAKLRSAKAASFSSSPTSPARPSLKEHVKKSTEPHIKLSIKSFTVPEFSVDLPESATIANLKRAVMEAAMNLFGGGLHVRVLLQGKKVSDENASLLQVGISQSRKMDSLGFMLEPSPIPTSPMNSEDTFLVLSSAAGQPTSRHSALSMDNDVDQETFKGHHENSNGTLGANYKAAGLQADAVKLKSDLDPSFNSLHGSLKPESRSIILHPSLGVEGVQDFALVPVHPKLQNVETGKRRMRRPFSVAEVEALVQAVEKLGTGRWRDVKFQAFDQAKHRTYVDLKDKWKTLVHTAQIAPHQRRGEPVPQELLDRVTQAHSYWTAQQVKQQAELGM